MTGRSGAARLALATRVPVVPLGNWGPECVMPGRRVSWPRFFPRKTMHVRVGPPVPLDDLYPDAGAEPSREAVHEATERILDAITVLVAELRGQEPPEGRWDSRAGRRVPRDGTDG
jgi:1-acyl-sn-glycerol-3-phosphate acyltransferase